MLNEFLNWAVTFALVMVWIEGVLLLAWLRKAEDGPKPLAIVCHLAAGFFLLGALKTSLMGWHPGWALLALSLALGAHLMDLAFRWSP